MGHSTTSILELTGTIIRGVGTGGHFVAITGFSRQFERILEGEPFPGTLNILVDEGDYPLLERLAILKTANGITIKGFREEGKDYFPAIALHCMVTILPPAPSTGNREFSIPALVVFPEVTVHPPGILEIIATERILDSAGIGDSVGIRF